MKKRAKQKKSKPKIRTILFDIGGVFQLPKYPVSVIQDSHLVGVPKNCFHRNKRVHEYLANKFKVLLDQWFDSMDTSYVMSMGGKLSEEQVVETISHNLGISKKRFTKFVLRAYKRFFYLNKDLLKIALKLKKQRYKIGILSDQWPLSKKALMPRSLTKHFNPVIVSCDVGLRKPNPKIYKLAIKKSNSSANQIVFIDNQKWNISAAKKQGMKAIIFKDNEQTLRDLQKLGIDIN